MANDPSHPWNDYRRFQAELAACDRVDDRSWGLEAALGKLLDSFGGALTEEELDRTVESTGRKERHRARLRRIFPAAGTSGQPAAPDARLDARDQLRVAHAQTGTEDWALLRAIGEGTTYGEMASSRGITAGRLRVRVLRLRRGLELVLAEPDEPVELTSGRRAA